LRNTVLSNNKFVILDEILIPEDLGQLLYYTPGCYYKVRVL